MEGGIKVLPINQEPSLNTVTSEAKQVILLKSQLATYIERFQCCTETFHLKPYGLFQIAVLFTVPAIWNDNI